MGSYKLVLFFAFCITLCYAKVDAGSDANNINPAEKSVNSTTPAEKQTYSTAVQSSLFPTDLTWKTSFGQALVFVGAAAFSFVLVGGLTLLFAPLFGYKVCSVLGNCGESATAYSAAGNVQNPAQNSYAEWAAPYVLSAPYNNYQKRSIEYIKPILETLAKTYEKSS